MGTVELSQDFDMNWPVGELCPFVLCGDHFPGRRAVKPGPAKPRLHSHWNWINKRLEYQDQSLVLMLSEAKLSDLFRKLVCERYLY